MDCMNCNKPIEASKGKRERLYCSDKCRKAFGRKAALVESKNGQNQKRTKTDTQKRTGGICRYCGAKIDDILVCCGPCAWSRPPNNANSLRFDRNAYTYTGTMTDYELEHYKPASELREGEFNPVSKPGDEHYRETG